MQDDHISSAYSESVERLVDLYVNEWDHSAEKTELEILNNFEMADSERQKALSYLHAKYGR